MKYSTVIFDLDGTLLNTLEDLKDSVNYSLEQHGFPARTLDEIKSFVGNGNRRLINLSVPQYTDSEITEDCFNVFKSHYKNNSRNKTSPYSGINTMLRDLKENGIRFAVVTNKIQDAANDVVKYYFGDSFEFIIGQKEGLAQKPAPDGVLYAMELLNADKSKTVYIGDSEVDCMTAHNSGLPVIGCLWGFRTAEILKEYKAEYIIDTPNKIIDIILGNDTNNIEL